MEGKKQSISGVIVPVITPVVDDRVDESSFRQLLTHLVEVGVHGLFVGGSSGEGPLLAPEEWQRMVEIAHDAVGETIPLLGGATDTSTRRVVDKIRLLEKTGYRYVVVTPTYYIPSRTVDEQLRLFARCREASGSMN